MIDFLRPYYRSIFSKTVLQHWNENKNSHRTMGLAIVPKPDPSHPLRRREKYIELPKSNCRIFQEDIFNGIFFLSVTPFLRGHRMPPIPKVPDRTCREFIPRKNFIRENINQMIHSLPRCPRRYVVSDRKGNKYLINGSGLQKDFIHKKVIATMAYFSNLIFKSILVELWTNSIVSSSI